MIAFTFDVGSYLIGFGVGAVLANIVWWWNSR